MPALPQLSAEERAKLDSYMLVIASEARGHAKHDGSGGKHKLSAPRRALRLQRRAVSRFLRQRSDGARPGRA